jgi:DNA polymerase-3 subunit beta
MMARKPTQGEVVQDKRKPATRVKAGSLAAALKDVLDVVESRNTIPVLANVLVEARDGVITLVGTDLDIIARRTLASDDRDGPASQDWMGKVRPLAMTVPARALASIVGSFEAEAMVTLIAPERGGGSASPGGSATAGDETRAVISAGRARFRLSCLPVDDFPATMAFPVKHSFTMGAAALADALAAVDYAVSTEETRYYLNGVYLHTAQAPGEPQVLRLAATDGNRLARRTLDVPEGAAAIGDAQGGIIIARKTVRLLDRLLPEAVKACGDGKMAEVLIEVAADGKKLRFAMPAVDGGEVEILAKAIDGSFPDYGRVIPTGNDKRAVIGREALIGALRRVSLLSPKESRAVKAEFGERGLRLSVVNAELGLAEEDLACEWDGPDFAVGFNGSFWRESLGALAGDDVIMRFADAGGPALVTGTDDEAEARFVQVLMPMRV